MNLTIISTRSDRSLKRIVEESGNKKLKTEVFFYKDLKLEGLKPKDFSKGFIILRDPYNSGRDFSGILRKIASFLKENQLLDYKTYTKYPLYEDKLFQSMFFKNTVKNPKFWHFKKPEDICINTFPVIVKKRISSRGKDVFLIKNKEKLVRV